MIFEDNIVVSPYSEYESVEGKTLSLFFADYFKKFGEQLCLVDCDDPEHRVTYDEFLTLVEKAAAFLQTKGVQSHTRVLLNLSNSIEAIIALFAVQFCNAVAINSKASAIKRELVYIIEDSQCSFVITNIERLELIRSIQDELGSQIEDIWISEDRSEGFSLSRENEVISISEIVSSDEELQFSYEESDDAEQHTCLICYTSGSTGLPKGVELTQTNLMVCALAGASPEGSGYVKEDDTFLLSNPLSHISGVQIILALLLTGAVGVVADLGRHFSSLFQIIENFQISAMIAFPVILQKMCNSDGQFGSLRRVMAGGSVIAPALIKKLSEKVHLREFRIGYGLSETMGAVTITIADHIEMYSVGCPVPGCRLKVVDLNTQESLGPREHGEICVKGQAVMKGYLNREEATRETFDDDGWLKTGDLGYYDEDGEFYIVERLKQLIKCMDNQVNPSELEDLLIRHESVAEVMVVGIPDDEVGEAPTAFVVLQEDFQESEELENELKEVIASQASYYKHLYGGVKFVDQLPKTDSGKMNRNEMKKIYLQSMTSQ